MEMNISTEIEIDGQIITVYGHHTPEIRGARDASGVQLEPDIDERIEFECADDENGDSVDLNIEGEQYAVDALWSELLEQQSI